MLFSIDYNFFLLFVLFIQEKGGGRTRTRHSALSLFHLLYICVCYFVVLVTTMACPFYNVTIASADIYTWACFTLCVTQFCFEVGIIHGLHLFPLEDKVYVTQSIDAHTKNYERIFFFSHDVCTSCIAMYCN